MAPLYTSASATYYGAPHLRRRNRPRSCFGCVGYFGTSRLDRLHPRAEAHPTRGASGSSTTSAPKVIHPRFRHRRPTPFGWAVPAQQNSHNSSSISVFIKSPLHNFLRRSEAVRGPETTTRPDMAKSFQRPFSPTPINLRLPVRARRTTSSRREISQLYKWPPEPRGYKHSNQALPTAIPHLLTKVCSSTYAEIPIRLSTLGSSTSCRRSPETKSKSDKYRDVTKYIW
jgi:hypothetical protein